MCKYVDVPDVTVLRVVVIKSEIAIFHVRVICIGVATSPLVPVLIFAGDKIFHIGQIYPDIAIWNTWRYGEGGDQPIIFQTADPFYYVMNKIF